MEKGKQHTPEEEITEELERYSRSYNVRRAISNMQSMLENSGIELQFKSRIKSPQSAIAKYQKYIERDGVADTEMWDALGMMVIVENIEDIPRVKDLMTVQIGSQPRGENNYIKNPRAGYRSLHVWSKWGLWASNEQVPTEIQIKTRAMAIAQDAIHDSIYKDENISYQAREQLSSVLFPIFELAAEARKSERPGPKFDKKRTNNLRQNIAKIINENREILEDPRYKIAIDKAYREFAVASYMHENRDSIAKLAEENALFIDNGKSPESQIADILRKEYTKRRNEGEKGLEANPEVRLLAQSEGLATDELSGHNYAITQIRFTGISTITKLLKDKRKRNDRISKKKQEKERKKEEKANAAMDKKEKSVIDRHNERQLQSDSTYLAFGTEKDRYNYLFTEYLKSLETYSRRTIDIFGRKNRDSQGELWNTRKKEKSAYLMSFKDKDGESIEIQLLSMSAVQSKAYPEQVCSPYYKDGRAVRMEDFREMIIRRFANKISFEEAESKFSTSIIDVDANFKGKSPLDLYIEGILTRDTDKTSLAVDRLMKLGSKSGRIIDGIITPSVANYENYENFEDFKKFLQRADELTNAKDRTNLMNNIHFSVSKAKDGTYVAKDDSEEGRE